MDLYFFYTRRCTSGGFGHRLLQQDVVLFGLPPWRHKSSSASLIAPAEVLALPGPHRGYPARITGWVRVCEGKWKTREKEESQYIAYMCMGDGSVCGLGRGGCRGGVRKGGDLALTLLRVGGVVEAIPAIRHLFFCWGTVLLRVFVTSR